MGKSETKEYVWHCPGDECRKKGMVLLKTEAPYLGIGRIRCPACKQGYTFYSIMKANKKNIDRYAQLLSGTHK